MLFYSFLILIIIVHQLFKMQTIAIPDRSALCVEIRSYDPYGDKFNANHHWTLGSLDSQIRIQSVTCSICGNYQTVSSSTLYDTLMESARHIVCEDPEHIHLTHEIIVQEAGRRYHSIFGFRG
jgi:hypothetical protein